MGDPSNSRPVLRALGRVLGDLSDLGYDCRWHGLRAADIGAPHGRFRVFVVASPAFTDDGGSWARRTWANWRPEPVDGVRDGALLGTPTARDGKGSGQGDRLAESACRGKSLSIEAQRLLQTPSVADALGGHLTRSGARSGEQLLPGQAKEMHGQDWGIYADAIARWEYLTRPAPAPTQPSKKGTPQLSPAFSEWLMGLPAGHVTDVPGLSRNDMLKALGNGVVPQQAEAALRYLLGLGAVAA